MVNAAELTEEGLEAVMGQPEAPNYDECFVEAWNSVVSQCQTRLEKTHFLEAVQVKSANNFRQVLAELQSEYSNKPEVITVLRTLLPTLDHYELFAATFVKLMKNSVETSMMWGLLSLVIRFSLKFDTVRARIGELFRRIGHKLEYFNEYGQSNYNNPGRLKAVSSQVHTDLVELWLNVITVFKDRPEDCLEPDTLRTMLGQFEDFIHKLDQAVQQIKDIVNLVLAASLREKSELLERFEQGMFLHGRSVSDQAQDLPCYHLPSARNPKFHGREEELRDIGNFFQKSTTRWNTSLVLFGMGGVGKSQVALHYALDHMDDYDAILWLHSQTERSLDASISDVVMKLQLPGANWNEHQENRTRLLLWLQRTACRWMLIHDNVDTADVLNHLWPLSKKGTIIITSRKQAYAVQPADGGIEILPFSKSIGTEFVLKNVSGTGSLYKITSAGDATTNENVSTEEKDAASKLSERLSGHPLALTQALSYGSLKKWTAQKLLSTYERYPKRLRTKFDRKLLHAGYTSSMNTVFDVSFESLSPQAFTILSIMSFFEPEAISEDLFRVGEDDDVPTDLGFLKDELDTSEFFQELLDLSLIHPHPDGAEYSMHRIVQSECKYHSSYTKRQQYYNYATVLLYVAFPKQTDERFGARLPLCAKLSPHVFALRDNLLGSGDPDDKPFPASDEFCILLRNASWYCVEVHQTKELEPTVTIALDAAIQTGFQIREPRHYAQLCNCASRLWAQRGNFPKALSFMLKCKEIREKLNMDVWSALNNLGNLYLSTNDPQKALQIHEECAALFTKMDPAPRHGLRVNRLNIGRTMTWLGRFDEARSYLHEAASIDGDWLMAIHIAYHQSLLLRAEGKLDESIASFKKTIASIENSTPYQSLLHACCLYKIGCVHMQKGAKIAARDSLQKSLDIHQVRDSPSCELARVEYMYARALEGSLPVDNAEKSQKLLEHARSIRFELTGVEKGSRDGEDVYDLLVEGQLR